MQRSFKAWAILALAIVDAHAASNLTFAPTGSRSTYNAGVRCASPWARVADFDRDGRKDIVVAATPMTSFTATSSPGEIMIFRGQADGSFVEGTQQLFSGPVSKAMVFGGVEVHDLNGDGAPDIFANDSGLDTYENGVGVGPWLGATPMMALSGAGKLSDAGAQFSGISPNFAHAVAMADIDRNGTMDVFIPSLTNYLPEKMSYLLLNDGRGNFTYDQSRLPAIVVRPGTAPIQEVNGTRYFSSQQWTGALFVDVNRDGAPDLMLFPIETTERGLLLMNDGTGYFNRSDPIELPPGLWGGGQATFRPNPGGSGGVIGATAGTHGLHSVAVDLNDDGYLDVAILETPGDQANNINYRGGRIQILINQQGRGFVDETTSRGAPGFTSGVNYDSYHAYLHAFDINQDGHPDLIATRVMSGAYEPHVFLNDGAGRFTRAALGGLPTRGVIVPISEPGSATVRLAVLDFIFRAENNGFGSACNVEVQAYEGVNSARGLAATDNGTGLWWHSGEPGWGLNLNQQGATLFGTLFSYAADGAPLWLVMPDGRREANGIYRGALYRTTGPAFNAVPFPPLGAGVGSVTQVGTMQVGFFDASVAELEYTVDGVTVRKRITPQLFGPRQSCVGATGPRLQRTNYTDLWWVPAESGWGLNVVHQGDVIFATLFTYEAGSGITNRGLWLVMSAGARQADGSYSGDLYQLSGPAFNAAPFLPVSGANITRVGGMTLRFESGERGTLTYDVNGVTVTKTIVPQVFGASPPLCVRG